MKTEYTINQDRLNRFSRKGLPLHRDQKRFLQIAALTCLISAVWFIVGKHTIYYAPQQWETYGDKLAFLTKLLVFAAIPLLMGITVIATQRLDPRNVIGQKLRTDTPADINKRYVANTVEQLLLFIIVHTAMIFYAPQEDAISFILLTALFVMGRLIFWVGYHRDKFTRALGFGITFYPIAGAYLWLMVRIIFDYHIPL